MISMMLQFKVELYNIYIYIIYVYILITNTTNAQNYMYTNVMLKKET